jgi:hypothetical protein
VEVTLPPATYDRINNMINSVLATPVPGWIMSLHAAQDGLTAGYYHGRNIERIEHAVDEIARKIYADAPAHMPATTMSFAARTLTYEYQALILALRRSFDYLAGALTSCGLGCDFQNSFRRVPRTLKQVTAEHRAAADAITAGCIAAVAAFPEVFADRGQNIRDQIAHYQSVPGGQFSVSFVPGQPVAVELEGGGEELPLTRDPNLPPGRLSAVLFDRLKRFEDVFAELAAHIPVIAEAARTGH